MAQKQDVLEQVVDDYLQHLGYFTRHNIWYRPAPDHAEYVRKKDSNYSDIDVIGIHPSGGPLGRVVAVSCKSWQEGFDPVATVRYLTAGNDEYIRYFRELWVDKCAAAFRAKVAEVAGPGEFTYVLAVTRLLKPVDAMRDDPTILANLGGNRFECVDFTTVWNTLVGTATTTLAASDIGRLVQLLKASRVLP
jgi:hypothetical protein